MTKPPKPMIFALVVIANAAAGLEHADTGKDRHHGDRIKESEGLPR